ncbi:MAG: hypothetical protein F6K58_12430 [Symploca sp. SIO2E9]|nr:hypothetical protein [Symploca sp. SIO2E9]
MNFKNLSFSSYLGLGYRQVFSLLSSFSVALALAGCNSVTTDQYEATAKTTLTWQVKYSINLANDKDPRFEEFASTSLINRNGEKPEGAANEDEKGLWWPLPPPRPSINEIEQRQKLQEKHSRPELLRTAEYYLTYKQGEQTLTLPTNHQVYRQVARAYPYGKSLQLTLGINDGSVEKAEPLR